MRLTGTLLGIVLPTIVAAALMFAATRNLPLLEGAALTIGVTALAALTGWIVGAAISRRAMYTTLDLSRFSTVAGAMGGGIIGAVSALTLTAAYLLAYAGFPSALFDQILFILSFPLFTAMGFCIGGLVGAVSGLLAGSALRLAARLW